MQTIYACICAGVSILLSSYETKPRPTSTFSIRDFLPRIALCWPAATWEDNRGLTSNRWIRLKHQLPAYIDPFHSQDNTGGGCLVGFSARGEYGSGLGSDITQWRTKNCGICMRNEASYLGNLAFQKLNPFLVITSWYWFRTSLWIFFIIDLFNLLLKQITV